MEKTGQPFRPQRGGRRGTVRTTRSSSSSSSFGSEFQSRPSSRPGPPNHNNSFIVRRSDNNNLPSKDYQRNKRVQHQQQQEEDDIMPSSSSLVGTCPFMCPVEERMQRERLRDLSVFERLNGNPGKTSPSLAVKKFCRTISTKHVQASDIRPLPILQDTLNYLLSLLDSDEHPFEVVHDFMFDRTRSIRQDLSMQRIGSYQVVQMFEKMVEFHVRSHHKLRRCSGDPNISSMYHLNLEQLTKALTSLYDLYEANRNSQPIYENEAEFRSLHVLLHLGSDRKPMGESLSLWFRLVSSPIMKSKEMCFARRVLRFYHLGNYKRFIYTTAAEASSLQYCIVEPFINEIRAFAVSCVNYGGYKLHPYPLSDLSKLLMMKVSDVESLCHDCGLETSTDEAGNRFLPTKQTSFCHPRGGFQNYGLVGLKFL
ncbi:SAC3 family protein C isoform X1 [Diospyros lotus]|uniref:SAC3 family protein C isoform X1 n=1 Tax=Diospyros lotus TaxID=55363 RepID=UPI0022591B24|nr:SAC3 family protein C isoform X1 [Diospyros lotus]